MSWLSILLFLVYTLGFGYSLTFFLKQGKFFERMTMRLGIGFCALIVLGIIFNLFRIPLDWRIFLALSLAGPLIVYTKKILKKEPLVNLKHRLMLDHIYFGLVLLIFGFSLFMYAKGAFSYPYLEDDDSWGHATGVKYAALEKTLLEKTNYDFAYLDPYPPAYDMVLGILHQTSDSLQWTLKFFNALFASMGLLFFYFFMQRFTGSKNKALLSTFILASIPAFLSHFIWSHTIVPALIVVIFYSLEMLKEDKRWLWPSAVSMGALFVTSVDDSIKFSIMLLIYFFIKALAEKRFLKEAAYSALIGSLLSLSWWGLMINRYGSGFKRALLGDKTVTSGICNMPHIGPCGTGTRPYSFNDIVFAKLQNMITNPIGIGLIVSILALIGLIYLVFQFKHVLSKEPWKLIVLLWFAFTYLGIHGGNKIPIALLSFRFWMLLAIPTAILAAEGLFVLFNLIKMPYAKPVLILISIIGILYTSSYPKYAVNTSSWTPGGSWTYVEQNGQISSPELNGYIWLKTLGFDKRVFTYGQDDKVIGFDQFMCVWCKEEREFKKKGLAKADELHSWLKNGNYEYFIMDAQTVKNYGSNESAPFIQEFVNNKNFMPVQQTEGFVGFKVV